jgi:hypothetical protein
VNADGFLDAFDLIYDAFVAAFEAGCRSPCPITRNFRRFRAVLG